MNCFRCVQVRQPGKGTLIPPIGPPAEAVCHLYMESSPTKLKPMCRECMDQFMRSYDQNVLKRGPAYELPLENWEVALTIAQVMES